MKEILIASNNKGKVKEIRELLEPYGIDKVRSANEFPYPEPEETGKTFKENALIKAKYYSEKTGLICLSDDSGMCVDELDGAPGIYSARWAGEKKDFDKAMQMVEQALIENGIATRNTDINKMPKAHFVCALCLYFPDGKYEIFEGKVFGKLTFPAKGDKGFGYDPIFIPNTYDKTFAEMEPGFKHSISHRAKAFNELKRFLEK